MRGKKKVVDEINEKLNGDSGSLVDLFISDGDARKKIIEKFNNSNAVLIYINNTLLNTSSFLSFLAKVFDVCWEKTMPNGAFHAYDKMLKIILDVITGIEYKKMSPALFQMLASALERIAFYIGDGKGKSWDANRTWNSRFIEISDEMKEELLNYATECYNVNTSKLLRSKMG
ncbi:MAG: hypothetical protein ACOX9C_01905 [Kiritimatiellia bacterium]